MYMTDVYRYSYGRLQDAAAAEDVAQETFIRLWNRAHQWKPTGRIRSWLLRIAHNLCADALSGKKPHIDLEKTIPFLAAGSLYDPRISYMNNQLSGVVQKALENIGERQQAAIVLTYYLDCTNSDAADVMDMSIDAFESLLSRARAALKAELKEYKHLVMES